MHALKLLSILSRNLKMIKPQVVKLIEDQTKTLNPQDKPTIYNFYDLELKQLE